MSNYMTNVIKNAPVLETSNQDLVNAWKMALHTLLEISTVECPMDHYNKTGLLDTEPGLMIRAGGGYPTPWTRDAAVNTMNAACFLEPEVAKNTLWAVCERVDGKLCFQMDKQSWDKIVWATGAWSYYLASGDLVFLKDAYDTVKNSLEILEEIQFNSQYGMFTGGSFFNDGITGYPKSLHEEGNGASFVKKHPATAHIMTLSTNCLYYNAYVILAKMVKEIGIDPDKEAGYLEKAAALKAAINKNLWSDKLGRYGYFIYPDGTLDESQEGCGLSFAVMFGLCDQAKAESILNGMVISERGLVSIWPPFEGISSVEKPIRHNNLIWPFINGYFADVAAKMGRADILKEELLNLTALALESKGFYEIYNPTTGEPDGGWQIGIHWQSVPEQTWSATGFIRMIVYALFGVNIEKEGLRFTPCMPEGMDTVALKGLRVRGVEMDLVLHAKEEGKKGIFVNGTETDTVSYSAPGRYSVEMWG